MGYQMKRMAPLGLVSARVISSRHCRSSVGVTMPRVHVPVQAK
jgi:hypothetical protein